MRLEPEHNGATCCSGLAQTATVALLILTLAMPSFAFTVSGTVIYSDQIGNHVPLGGVTVKLMDNEWYGLDQEIGSTSTDANGQYVFPSVDNNDGLGENGRDLYVIIEMRTGACYVEDALYSGGSLSSSGVYTWWGANAEGIVDTDVNGSDKVYDVHFLIGEEVNDASEIVTKVTMAYNWIVSHTTAGDAQQFANLRSAIMVYYDASQGATSYFDDYDWCFWLWDDPEKIVIFNNAVWNSTPYHEYAHAVHDSMYESAMPGPAYPDYDGDGDGEHVVFSQSQTAGSALLEGWAEFFECAVENDSGNVQVTTGFFDWNGNNQQDPGERFPSHDWSDIEDNSWWAGEDFDGSTNPDGNSGSIVEGAVASIFWDIFDSRTGDDDGLSMGFDEIFAIMLHDKPSDIVEFANHWVSTGDSTPTAYGHKTEMFDIYFANNVDAGLPVELVEFSAQVSADATVLIQWQTASETKNAAWNILRKSGENNWQTVNDLLIPGVGTAPFGETYEFVDTTGSKGDQYRLEWVSFDGKLEHSPEIGVGQQIGAFMANVEEKPTDKTWEYVYPEAVGLRTCGVAAAPSDYLIIVPSALAEAVTPLAQYRSKQGHRVVTVAVEDIYAQYPTYAGNKAIQQFIQQCAENWTRPKLHYVLLVGDAVMLRGGSQEMGRTLVPTMTVEHPAFGRIASDYPYATMAGGDVCVGRLPVRSAEDVHAAISKIIDYEKGRVTRHVGFVNGEYFRPQDSYAEVTSEAVIAAYCEGALKTDRIYFMPEAEELQQYQGGAEDLARLMQAGCDWLEFRGHGAGGLWGSLLEGNSVKAMRTVGRVPVIASLSCFTGAFADPENRVCVGESLLRNPDGGCVAYIGNTGHGMVFGGHNLSMAMWEELDSGDSVTIGDALFRAKRQVAEQGGDRDFLNSVNLFGDPAMRVGLMSSGSSAVVYDAVGPKSQVTQAVRENTARQLDRRKR